MLRGYSSEYRGGSTSGELKVVPAPGGLDRCALIPDKLECSKLGVLEGLISNEFEKGEFASEGYGGGGDSKSDKLEECAPTLDGLPEFDICCLWLECLSSSLTSSTLDPSVNRFMTILNSISTSAIVIIL